MATLDEASKQLADSLPVEAVPAKLRCGSCNKLAVDAVKVPCCDQSICEPCSQTLSDACPICGHSPVAAEDCKPNRNLRMTIKAFIKSEEKKRSKESETPAAPFVAAPSEVPLPTPKAVAVSEVDPPVDAAQDFVGGERDDTNVSTLEQTVPKQDEVVQSVEQNVDDSIDNAAQVETGHEEEEEDEDEDDDIVITTERPQPSTQELEQQSGEGQSVFTDEHEERAHSQMDVQPGFNMDQMQQGFGNMDFNNMNNFNQMLGMHNGIGIPNFGMGMPNMMGMGMDPSMMFNGGFGGMGGMNDMSSMMNMGMGMGMGGFGGMPGMNMNMGGGGPGFFPGNAGGHNHPPQNFGNHMNQPFHHNRGYGRGYSRGFGRGRGFNGAAPRGRAGWQNTGQYPNHNQGYMNQQSQGFQNGEAGMEQGVQVSTGRGSPIYESASTAEDPAADANTQTSVKETEGSGVDETGKGDIADQTGDGNIEGEAPGEASNGALVEVKDAEAALDTIPGDVVAGQAEVSTENVGENGMSAVDMTGQQYYQEQQYQQGYGYVPRGRGGFRGSFRGRGGAAYGDFTLLREPEQTPAPPTNAPTGPKAMRQGLPNSGIYSRTQTQTSATPVAPSTRPAPETSQAGEREEHDRSTSRPRSRSRHESRRDQHRHADEESEDDEAYARRKERERRKRRERERRSRDSNGDEAGKKGRSRSESPDDDHHHRRRHRDRDENHDSSRSRRDRSRERRKHRHRSRSPDEVDDDQGARRSRHKTSTDRREEYESYDRSKSRKHSRRDDIDNDSKDRSHTSSRHGHDRERKHESSKHKPVVHDASDDIGFSIKGVSKNKSSQLDSATQQDSTPSNTVDYEEERQRYKRARESRHQQLKDNERKRSIHDINEDGFDAPTGPKGDREKVGSRKRVRKDERTHSLRYEDEIARDSGGGRKFR